MRRCVFAKGMNSPLHQTSNRAETLTRLGRSFIFRAIHLRPPRASAIPAMKQRIRRTLGAVLLFGVGFVSRPYIERLVYESPLHPQKATGEYVLMVPPGRVHFMLLQNGSAYELTEGPFIFLSRPNARIVAHGRVQHLHSNHNSWRSTATHVLPAHR